MDYKKAYEETIEKLYFVTRENNNWRKEEDTKYYVLTQLSEVISALFDSIDSLPIQRKIAAENTLKKLLVVFDNLAKFYFDEMVMRKKLFKAQSEILELSRKIEQLENELKVEKELNKF